MKEDMQRPFSVRKHNHNNDANDTTKGTFLCSAYKGLNTRQTE